MREWKNWDALFAMCSPRSMKARLEAVGNNSNISPYYPTKHYCVV